MSEGESRRGPQPAFMAWHISPWSTDSFSSGRGAGRGAESAGGQGPAPAAWDHPAPGTEHHQPRPAARYEKLGQSKAHRSIQERLDEHTCSAPENEDGGDGFFRSLAVLLHSQVGLVSFLN